MDDRKFKKYGLEIVAECTNAQLRTLNELIVRAIRTNREHEIAKAKLVFAIGQQVAFTKAGVRYVGTLTKINRTMANVSVKYDKDAPTQHWKVSLALLRAA